MYASKFSKTPSKSEINLTLFSISGTIYYVTSGNIAGIDCFDSYSWNLRVKIENNPRIAFLTIEHSASRWRCFPYGKQCRLLACCTTCSLFLQAFDNYHFYNFYIEHFSQLFIRMAELDFIKKILRFRNTQLVKFWSPRQKICLTTRIQYLVGLVGFNRGHYEVSTGSSIEAISIPFTKSLL